MSTRTINTVFVASLLLLAGCEEALVQPGPMAIDREVSPAQAIPQRALDHEVVDQLVTAAFLNYWRGTQDCQPALTLTVAADENSTSWANYAMRHISSEPRQAWDNSLGFRYWRATQSPWDFHYRAIKAANEALRMIDSGVEVGPAGRDTEAARALATFVQAGVRRCAKFSSRCCAF